MPSPPTTSPLPLRPRLKETTEVLPAGDGELYLVRPSGDADFSVRDTPLARALFQHLTGATALTELVPLLLNDGVRVEESEIRKTLSTLVELGLVEDGADDDELTDGERTRYDRQLRYFSDLAPPGANRAAYQARLRDARVVVMGLGGLGSWAAYALTCAGLGRIDLVDGDLVEVSNLNRQILYEEADIGRSKAEVATRRLRAFNSEVLIRPVGRRLASEAEVGEAIADADFVVDAADWPVHEIERWVDSACFQHRVPYITLSQFPPLARVGPTYLPGTTPCFRCQEAAFRSDFPLFDELAEQRRLRPSPAATFGPACGLIGSQAAVEAVHLLTGICRPASLGVALVLDLRTMEITRHPVPRRPDCPRCS